MFVFQYWIKTYYALFFFFGFAPESGAAQPGFGGSTATNEDSEKQTSGCIAYKLVYANYGKETETN